MKQMTSVIIPAHNEEQVLDNLLNSLVPDFVKKGNQIIVVCNACTDNTAKIAAQYPEVKIIETEIASKINALNLGNSESRGEVVVYMDADVIMNSVDLKTMLNFLSKNKLMAVSPNVKMNFIGSSWFVRAYYGVWLQLPYVKEGFMGSGIYALSAEGRKRFDNFPDVISDDGFIRGLFQSYEVSRVDEVFSSVKAPKTLSGLIKIKTRSRLGQYDLMRKLPNMKNEHKKTYGNAFLPLLMQPKNWINIIIYFSINIFCRTRAKRILRAGGEFIWETDKSSRSEM